jgi:AAA family ATP:ADP antiporter
VALGVTKAKPEELAAALWAFVYFFALLAGYYVLRPIRDEISMEVGARALQGLFSAVFFTMLAVVPLFGWLTRRFARRQLLPSLYAFFALDLLAFFLVMRADGAQSALWGRVFYVWVSVFNLFVISVFWSFMADIFDTEQARRLYGFISAGGTAGALVGPIITSQLVGTLGAKRLMLVSAAFLLLAILAIRRLGGWAQRRARATVVEAPAPAPPLDAAAVQPPVVGSVWSGLGDVIRSRYLLAICAFLLAYALLSTFLYFQTAELLPQRMASAAARTQLLARIDLAVNVLALLLQLLAFRPLIQRVDTAFVLALLPLVSLVGFALFALHPLVSVLLVFGLTRRAGEYALSKPARETLFNVLPLEQKYRAKNVIDTLVHRTGDTASAWIFTGLRGLGLRSVQISWLSVPIAGAWLAVAVWLGRQAERRRRAAGQGWEPPMGGDRGRR